MASRVQKNEVFKKGLNFTSSSRFASCIMKKHYFFHGGKKRCFFLIFTMKLSSAALNYLNADLTLNFG